MKYMNAIKVAKIEYKVAINTEIMQMARCYINRQVELPKKKTIYVVVDSIPAY